MLKHDTLLSSMGLKTSVNNMYVFQSKAIVHIYQFFCFFTVSLLVSPQLLAITTSCCGARKVPVSAWSIVVVFLPYQAYLQFLLCFVATMILVPENPFEA